MSHHFQQILSEELASAIYRDTDAHSSNACAQMEVAMHMSLVRRMCSPASVHPLLGTAFRTFGPSDLVSVVPIISMPSLPSRSLQTST